MHFHLMVLDSVLCLQVVVSWAEMSQDTAVYLNLCFLRSV